MFQIPGPRVLTAENQGAFPPFHQHQGGPDILGPGHPVCNGIPESQVLHGGFTVHTGRHVIRIPHGQALLPQDTGHVQAGIHLQSVNGAVFGDDQHQAVAQQAPAAFRDNNPFFGKVVHPFGVG